MPARKLNRQIADISRKIEDLNKEAADMLAQKSPSDRRMQSSGWKSLPTISMSGKWQPAWKIRKKTTTFYAAGCQKTMLHALWKKSKMMTRYLLSWKKTGTLILEILRSSCRTQSCSNHLKCSSACTDFLLTTRSIRLFLLPSPTPLFSESCSVMWGRDCCC